MFVLVIYALNYELLLNYVQKIPDAVNRQRSHDSFVIESVSPSSNVTNADQGHLSNESDESD